MSVNNLFITGGSGFIGTHFHQKYDNTKIINYDILPPFVKNKSTYIQGDIKDLEKVTDAMKGCDTILHLAATHADFHKNYFSTNRDGTAILLEAASKNNIDKFIFYSSVAVYGAEANGATEKQIPKPNMPYGASKLAAEKLIQAWVKENPQRAALIIRPAAVFGAYNFANIFNLIKQIDSGFYMNIGDGKNIKSITYVENIVNDTIIFMKNWTKGTRIYNHTTSPNLYSHQISEIIAKLLGKKRPMLFPLSLAKLLVFPFDLLIKITGKNFPISRARLKKFCTQTYYISENIDNQSSKEYYSTQESLQKTVEWYKNTNWKPLFEEWQRRIIKYS